MKPTTPSRRFPRLFSRVLSFLAITILSFFSYQLYHTFDSSKLHAQAPKTSVAAPTTAATTQMAQQINQIIQAHPDMEVSVAIHDLNTNQSYSYGETAAFEAASVTKLVTAAAYLHDVDQGTRSLTDPVGGDTAQNQLQALIENSDNTAWENLNTILGHPELDSFAQSQGLQNYDADANTVTAADISSLLTKLYKNQLLSHNSTQLLLSYMKNANETDFIPAAVPSNVSVYHKAGWLDDRIHDAAIIDNGTHAYVLVVFTKQANYDVTSGQTIFHGITKATTATLL